MWCDKAKLSTIKPNKIKWPSRRERDILEADLFPALIQLHPIEINARQAGIATTLNSDQVKKVDSLTNPEEHF